MDPTQWAEMRGEHELCTDCDRDYCVCHEPWPCRIVRLLDEVQRNWEQIAELFIENERLRERLSEKATQYPTANPAWFGHEHDWEHEHHGLQMVSWCKRCGQTWARPGGGPYQTEVGLLPQRQNHAVNVTFVNAGRGEPLPIADPAIDTEPRIG